MFLAEKLPVYDISKMDLQEGRSVDESAIVRTAYPANKDWPGKQLNW